MLNDIAPEWREAQFSISIFQYFLCDSRYVFSCCACVFHVLLWIQSALCSECCFFFIMILYGNSCALLHRLWYMWCFVASVLGSDSTRDSARCYFRRMNYSLIKSMEINDVRNSIYATQTMFIFSQFYKLMRLYFRYRTRLLPSKLNCIEDSLYRLLSLRHSIEIV